MFYHVFDKAIALQEETSSVPAKIPAYPDGLLSCEVEVLRLIACGKSNRLIAEEPFISPITAGHHVSNLLNTSGCANRAELVAYGTRHGLVS